MKFIFSVLKHNRLIDFVVTQFSTFHVKGSPAEISSRVISERVRGPSEGLEDVWVDEPFLIPPVVPYTLPHCKIIDVYYRIQVKHFLRSTYYIRNYKYI